MYQDSAINPVIFGVDVGGTKIQIGAFTGGGNLLSSKRYPMFRGSQEESVSSVKEALGDFVSEWTGIPPAAIGIGLPGEIDYLEGVWNRSLNLRISQPVRLAEELQNEYGCPIYLDNDVHMATFAELIWGTGRFSKHFIFVNIGTGISAGLVNEEKLLRGTANFTGEIGHMIVEPDGDPCHCGHFGCLENIASGYGLTTHANQRMVEYPHSILHKFTEDNQLNPTTIFHASEDGDELASILINRALRGVGIAMVNLVNLLNPEHLIFGGGAYRDERMIAKIRDYISTYSLKGSADTLKSVSISAMNVDQVGMMGAACLGFMHHNKL